MEELSGVIVFKHNSIRINRGKVIYIDPFNIDLAAHDADIVLCTHSHYDHFSPKDILAVSNESTVLFTTEDCRADVEKMGFSEASVHYVKPGEEYDFEGIYISTIPAYNKFKPFHPKKNNWVGYLITAQEVAYYVAGDTDKTKEALAVECDVAFLPVGGTYTMDYNQAASLCYKIKPKCAIPTHYGLIVGEQTDGASFKKILENEDIQVELYF